LLLPVVERGPAIGAGHLQRHVATSVERVCVADSD
jgi:hypothetical protein